MRAQLLSASKRGFLLGLRHKTHATSVYKEEARKLLLLNGAALVLAALLVFARYHVVSDKQFGGITGDLAGWFLQKAELWMLAALCACQWGGLL